MKNPTAICNLLKGSMAINIDGGSINCSRDWFLLIVDGLKDKAFDLTKYKDCKDDAIYLEAIADAITVAVEKNYAWQQKNISNIFG